MKAHFKIANFMSRVKLVFLSSSEISLPLLKCLLGDERFEIQALICQPDRPAGRGQKLKSPAPKEIAVSYGIPVFQPDRLSKANDLFHRLHMDPPDFLLTFAYGQILSQKWLDLAKRKALNVHTSLLPKHRGASPIQSALLAGDQVTGISFMEMLKAMDAGPVAAMSSFEIAEEETAGTLFDRMSTLAAHFIPEQLLKLYKGELVFHVQDHSLASYCSKISKEDARLNFTCSREQVWRAYRAYTPWPALWTVWSGKRLKLLKLALSEPYFTLNPGEFVINEERLFFGVKDAPMEILELQMEGKSAMPAADFIRGFKDLLKGGSHFDT